METEQMEQELQAEKRVVKRGEIPFDLEAMVTKVAEFCKVVSGMSLYEYQMEYAKGIIRSLLLNDGEEVTALFSRQSGKTETNACVVAGCMIILPTLAKLFPMYEPLQNYKDGLWVGIFAPSGGQAMTTYDRLRTRIKSKNSEMVMRDDDFDLTYKTKGGCVSLSNGSFTLPMSASKQSHIESKTYHLLLVEEAQDVDNRVMKKSIHPMGAATSATVIKVGTANAKKSDFSDAIARNRRKNRTSKRKYHFQNDYKIVQKCNPRYKAYVDKERERYGEDSDEFRMAYKCEFIFERGMFMSETRWDELIAGSPKNMQLVSSKKTGTQVAGIDWAKRQDSTVVTILDVDWNNPIVIDPKTGETHYKKVILDWLEIYGDDYDSQFWQIVDFLERYNIQMIVSDATGSGDPMVDRLTNFFEGVCEVEGIVFSTSSKHLMYTLLNQEVLAGRFAIPHGSRVERNRKWQNFKDQLLDLEKSWRGKYMVCHHPDVKGAHDDYPDSLVLATWAANHEGMGEMEMEDNPFFQRVSSKGIRGRNALLAGR